jgi:uncharacterized membrane protein YsdA (DUF1294 family)
MNLKDKIIVAMAFIPLFFLAFSIISLALLFLYMCDKNCRKHDRQCQSEHEWTSLHFHSFNGGESKTLHYFAEGYGTHMRNHKVG